MKSLTKNLSEQLTLDDETIINHCRRLISCYTQEPEKRLCAAILAQAIDDIFLCRISFSSEFTNHNRSIVFENAYIWIQSADDDSFSFNAICSALNIDAARLRRLILKSLTEKKYVMAG